MNPTLSLQGFLIILISFLLALMLSIMPLPDWAINFRPQWLPLVLIYWVIALPHRVSLGVAWILGFLLDGLYGTVLGEHALALVIVAYVAEKLYRQLRMFPLMQQALSVFLFIILYQGLLLWIQGVLGQLPNVRWFWISALTSMIIWPWLFTLLRACRRKFMVY
jgi:rod shape-determining protein MreD